MSGTYRSKNRIISDLALSNFLRYPILQRLRFVQYIPILIRLQICHEQVRIQGLKSRFFHPYDCNSALRLEDINLILERGQGEGTSELVM